MRITEGVFPVIVTPFDESNDVDHDALATHVRRLEDADVDGIIPCGTTGEIATLSDAEQRAVIETVADATSLPVVAGTGSNATWQAVERTTAAAEVGADGALVVSPYYNTPSQSGLRKHYERIADASDIPLVLYNVPHRTGVNVEPETIVELADHPNVAGIKDSRGDMNQLSALCSRTREKEFDVVSGYDSLLFPLLDVGGTGVVSITANVFPERMVELYRATRDGDHDRAREIHRAVIDLQEALFVDTNPVPTKKAMELRGHFDGRVRQPLDGMSEEDVATLEDALDRFERRTA
jgi:4-hydroxy-tetrahydrodipicolinate synthase